MCDNVCDSLIYFGIVNDTLTLGLLAKKASNEFNVHNIRVCPLPLLFLGL